MNATADDGEYRTMKTNTQGPAFPVLGRIVDGEWEPCSQFTGITIRDYFAAKAMAAYLAGAHGNPPEPETTAECAYFMADAMIAERNK